jgi:hypothetical protein
LHEEHGCHFHVITNQRFSIQKILAFSNRYGFGRLNVRRVSDPAKAIRYLCKYLSKRRPGCLKRARLWSAFGKIDRTRVKDVLTDTPMTELVRRLMGKPTVSEELAGIERLPAGAKGFRPERNFQRAIEKAKVAYLFGFDSEYFERQEAWQKLRLSGLVDLSHPWSAANPLADESWGRYAGESSRSDCTGKVWAPELSAITRAPQYFGSINSPRGSRT